jgi:hypothetical protein
MVAYGSIFTMAGFGWLSANSHSMVHPFLRDGAVEEPPTIDNLTMVKLPTWSKGGLSCLTILRTA